MQKLRPYVLPGLFAFHLVTLCVLFTAVSRQNEAAAVMAGFTILSQFFLTALFAGLGTGSWSLQIPSRAALNWSILVSLPLLVGNIVVAKLLTGHNNLPLAIDKLGDDSSNVSTNHRTN